MWTAGDSLMRELGFSTHTARSRSVAQQAHWLLQANRALATDMLSSAQKAGARDSVAWSARILALTTPNGAGARREPALLARMVANLNPNNPVTVGEVRQLARDHAAAEAKVRTAEQARIAFNRPSHWALTGDGTLAPIAQTLTGESASAWTALTTKFDAGLAPKLFDAYVRGGMKAVMAELDAKGSTQSLTFRNLAQLQRVAQTDGVNNPLARRLVEALTVHDLVHSIATGYGTSEFQELAGDRFAEDFLRYLYKLRTEEDLADDALFERAPKIDLDVTRPLAQQPEAVREVKALIASQFEGVSSRLFGPAVDAAFYAPKKNTEVFTPEARHDWTGKSPTQAARQAEQVLDANGLLAHLDPAARERVLSTVYGPPGSDTLEGLVSRNPPSGPGFQEPFIAWVRYALSPAVVRETPSRLISRKDFNSRAEDAFALGLLLERTAPGALATAPSSTTVASLEELPGIAALNLRTALAPVRDEVRRAFATTP
jgi:hypothetical protein